MELLKNWIFSVCGASITVSIIKLILNESKVKKTVNVFLSIFLLFYMIAPFGKKENRPENFDFEKEYSSEFSTTNSYEDLIYSAIETVCQKEKCKVLDINIDYTELDSEIVIKDITVIINNKEKAEVIKEELKVKYGFEVTVF